MFAAITMLNTRTTKIFKFNDHVKLGYFINIFVVMGIMPPQTGVEGFIVVLFLSK